MKSRAESQTTLSQSDRGGALPPGFCTDQGALVLRITAADKRCVEPGALVRATVLAAELGLHLGPETMELLSHEAGRIRELSAAKRGTLLLDLLLCDAPADAVDLAVRAGLLQQILPDIDRLRAMPRGQGRYKDVYTHTLRVLMATPLDPITRLGALMHDIAKPDTLVLEEGIAHFPNHDLVGADRAARRLRALGFSREIVGGVEVLVRLHLRANSYESNWTDSAVRRLHLDAGDHWQRLLDLSFADVTSARPDIVTRARRRVQELSMHAASLDKPAEVSPLDGTVLMDYFGRGPGRWIGDLKSHLIGLVRDGVLDPDDEPAAWATAERFFSQSDRN